MSIKSPRVLFAVLLSAGTLAPRAHSDEQSKLTDEEKIEWYCSQHADEGPNCRAHARMLLPYIPDTKEELEVDPGACDFSPTPPGCPGAHAAAPAPGGHNQTGVGVTNPGGSAGHQAHAPVEGARRTPTVENPAAGCPRPEGGALDFVLKLSGADRLIMPSGRVASAVLDNVRAAGGRSPSGQVIFGESPVSPRAATIEISISRCRGVIDVSDKACYLKSSNPSFVKLDWIEEPIWGSRTDAIAAAYALCRAYASAGPHYVNVRYTYAASDCRLGQCGFVNQWNFGGFSDAR